MSKHLIGWPLAIAIGLTGAALLPESMPAVFRPLTLGLILGIGAIVIEFVIPAVRRPPESRERRPRDRRPADGIVDIAPLPGFPSTPNAVDPRFGRFIGPAALGEQPDTPRPGSIPQLLGRVVCVSVFIGRDGQRWSEQEIARSHTSLLKAGIWLEAQAARWSAAVNLEVAGVYFEVNDPTREDDEVAFELASEGLDQAPFDVDAGPKLLGGLSRAAVTLGFPSARSMISLVEQRLAADAIVWLVHPRRAGTSMAFPATETGLAGVNFAVCFARETPLPTPLGSRPPWTDPVTVVHELLHLFGASDKYAPSLTSYPAKSVTERDVMRLTESALSRLRVDRRTAEEIGWAGSGGGRPKKTTTAVGREGRGRSFR